MPPPADRDLTKLNKGQCKVLERKSPRPWAIPATTRLDSRSAEKTLGVLGDTRLTRSHQRAPGAREVNGVLGCVARGAREGLLHLCPVLGRPLLECSVQCQGSQYTRDVSILERVQWRTTKKIKGQEHLSCEERLGELGLLSQEKAQGTLSVWRVRGDGARLSSAQCQDWGSRHRLNHWASL